MTQLCLTRLRGHWVGCIHIYNIYCTNVSSLKASSHSSLPVSLLRGQASHPDCPDEDQQRGRELLVLFVGGGVLCQRLGPGPDAEEAHTREVPARGSFLQVLCDEHYVVYGAKTLQRLICSQISVIVVLTHFLYT